MDISGLKPGERTIEILHPATGAAIGIRVTIVSLDDDRLRQIKREITDNRMRLEQRGKPVKSEELEANTQRLLFAATKGWEWYNPTGKKGDAGFDEAEAATFNGEVPAYNQKNFIAVITVLPWFANQLSEAIGETQAFFDNSKSN